jgi:hypothetical protein
MLVNDEIKQNEIIKVLVLVEEEDLEIESYAIVQDNRGDYLEIRYLEETNRIYKSAPIHSYSDKIDIIRFDSVAEHHPGINELTDIDMQKVGDNMYAYLDEIDIDEDSDIISIYEDEEDYELDDFVVEDGNEIMERPPDHREIDEEWNNWNPVSPGALRFKQTIDMIEYHVNQKNDENAFK